MQSTFLKKLSYYLAAAKALGSLNIKGIPALPKSLFRNLPYNREHYNQFIYWMDKLQLSQANFILDIGANHADFSEAATAIFPAATVWLFEPLSKLHPELHSRVATHAPYWTLQPVALGASASTMNLHVDPLRDDIASLVGFSDDYKRHTQSDDSGTGASCQVLALDDLISQFPSPFIDLIKIDVEGFEFEVLQGAQKALAQTKAVIVEVSLMRQAQREGDKLVQMLTVLEQAGLHPVDILPSWFSATKPWLPLEFNILARRNS